MGGDPVVIASRANPNRKLTARGVNVVLFTTGTGMLKKKTKKKEHIRIYPFFLFFFTLLRLTVAKLMTAAR